VARIIEAASGWVEIPRRLHRAYGSGLLTSEVIGHRCRLYIRNWKSAFVKLSHEIASAAKVRFPPYLSMSSGGAVGSSIRCERQKGPQTNISAYKMLQAARMAAMRKLHRTVAWNSQSPVRADHTQAASRLGNNEKHLLNGHRSKHVIGVEAECTAPELGLEHMTHLLADGVFTGLDQQSRPFERPQHAR
jgi:hypothetical protein